MNHSMITSALAIVGSASTIYAANVAKTDLARLRGDTLWLAGDRLRMLRALDTVIQGGLEVAGVPPVRMPSELLAAGIACFVHPVNWPTASHWLGETYTVSAEAIGVESGRDKPGVTPLKPRQLYALVCQAYDAPEPFRNALVKKLDKLVQPGETV